MASLARQRDRSDPNLGLMGAGMAAIAALFVVSPYAAAFLLPLFAALPFAGLADRRASVTAAGLTPLLVALALLGLYLSINATWAVTPLRAAEKVGLFALYTLATIIGARALAASHEQTLERLSRVTVAVVFMALAYLLVEILLHLPIKRLLATFIPALKPSAKHILVKDGWVIHVGAHLLNRSVAALTLMLWPALAMLALLHPKRQALPLAVILVAGALLLLARAEHETSFLALLLSLVVFALSWISVQAGRALVTAGWLTATLLVVPLALLAKSNDLHTARWLPDTGRARIILWSYTAEQVLKKPVLGVGIGSTKELDEEHAPTAVRPDGYAYPLRTGRHSHNVFMQAWYELGAIGAFLLLTIGLLILRKLSRLPEAAKPYGYALFTAAAVIGAFSWGMWQPWFMAAFGLASLFGCLAFALARHRSPQA